MAACGDSGSDSDFEDPSGTDEICEDDFCDSKSSDSSDSNGASSSSFKKKEADISANSYMDSSAIGTQFNSKMGTMNILEGTLYDSTYNREYRTVTIGAYTWIAENIDEAITAFQDYDMCYDNSAANCKTDGRLFRNYTKNNMCPGNFTVPSSADYRYLLQVSSQLTNANLGFNPQMAGFCRENSFKADSSGCFDREKKSYLLTNDDSLFVIDASGKAGMAKPESYGFYSLRCVKMSSIVDTEKQLPTCNLKGNVSRSMFVASEGVNYTCKDGKWSKQTDKSCYSRGEKHYYNDKLYICNGSWELATMEETGAECSENNQNEVRELNGVKYICDDSTWRKPNATENSIGICTSDKIGTLDTIPAGQSLDFYYCDSTGWRAAKLVDYAGKCDDSKFYKTIDFGTVSYACRTDSTWTKMTAVEQELGICEPKRYNDIDTINIGVYACDSSGWHTAGVGDYYGKCTELKINTIVDFNKSSYACIEPPTWTQIDNITKTLGFCTADIQGTIKDYSGTPYICDSKWRTATQAEFLGECTEEIEGTSKKFSGRNYGCKNLKWKSHTALDDSLGFCSKKTLDEIKTLTKTNVTYKCLDTGWTVYTPEVAFGKCNDNFRSEHNKEIFKLGDKEYVCWITGWRTPQATLKLEECTASKVGTFEEYLGDTYYCSPQKNWIEVVGPELEHGLCEDGKTDIVTYNGKKYGCSREDYDYDYDRIYYNVVEFKWREETELDRAMGFCHSFGMEWKKYNGLDYVCDRDQMGWKNSFFWAMYTSCDKRYPYKYGVTVGFKDSLFYCDEDVEPITSEYKGWHVITPIDEEKGACRKAILDETILFEEKTYKCVYDKDTKNSYYIVYQWALQE